MALSKELVTAFQKLQKLFYIFQKIFSFNGTLQLSKHLINLKKALKLHNCLLPSTLKEEQTRQATRSSTQLVQYLNKSMRAGSS